MRGVETVEQQRDEGVEHLQGGGLGRRHFGFLQTQVEELESRSSATKFGKWQIGDFFFFFFSPLWRFAPTLSPASTRMCMLVRLLTGALRPPLLGVGGRRRQLGGGSLGSGGGLAKAFSLHAHTHIID